jgi:hypothetical protein
MFDAPDKCDCPACSGADFDPRRLIDDLLADTADLVGCEDPLEAELTGAVFMSIGVSTGEVFENALVGGFIPEFEARASSEALAMLLVIASVAGGRVGKEARAAVSRLVEAGVSPPRWAAELNEPVTVGDCWRLRDSQGAASMLACSFHRAGRSHAVMMSVDHLDCGAAGEILLLDADQLPEAVEIMRAGGDSGLEITKEALDAGEFRWQVENALDARAVHDNSDLSEEGLKDRLFDEEGLPGYPAMAVLVRARMSALPMPRKPAAPHGGESDLPLGLTVLQALEQLVGNGGPRFGGGLPILPGTPAAAVALPAKRTKSDRKAPIYQIKVSLRGAKPPIWRRLQVPADISLARLHTVIQVAFGWHGGHLHVFETPYGEFGTGDADLGHQAEEPVTLEQVAAAVKSKIRYTYDLGDDWQHDIVVEKVLDRDETAAYPRCTGGRRAAPPDDCGGVWGYADLVETLNDPAHPEHEGMLEWLGLDDAAEFDPDSFDAETVTRSLSTLR